MSNNSQVPWPELPIAAWRDTAATVQLWTQIVGKIRLTKSPWLNHSWHVTLYVTPRGLTTSPVPDGTRTFQIDFDFVDHRLRITTSDSAQRHFALPGHSVASFYAATLAALAELGIEDVYVVGLAKRLEEVWLPDSDFPVILPRASAGLYLLQRIRDEAHRFAISFHRQKRGKAMTVSALDGVPGLGESKRKALLARFGSVKSIRTASVEELTGAKGIGPSLAAAIVRHFTDDDGGATVPAINMTTGEILET